jgi:hypothetical protein
VPVDFVVHDDGKGPALYAAGPFTTAGDVVANGVARFDASGWHALGDGIPVSQVRSPSEFGPHVYSDTRCPTVLASLDDGSGAKLYAAGVAAGTAFPTTSYVMRWDGASWSTIPNGPPLDFPTQSLTIRALVMFDAGTGPDLYVGGSGSTIDQLEGPYLARWDGATWTRITNGPNRLVCDPWTTSGCPFYPGIYALTVFDDGNGPALWAGGDFLHVGGNPGRSLARFDGTVWSAPFPTGTPPAVTKLVVHDAGLGAALYAAGSTGVRVWNGTSLVQAGTPAFIVVDDLDSVPSAQGGSLSGLWAVGSAAGPDRRPWRFDGVSWTQVSAVLDAGGSFGSFHIATVYDAGQGPSLYVGGEFHRVNGVAARYVTRWDGSNWFGTAQGEGFSQFHGGRPGFVTSAVAFDDGNGPKLYVGGQLSWADGLLNHNLVRRDASGWTDMFAGALQNSSACVTDLLRVDRGQGPELWITGSMYPPAGNEVYGLARILGGQLTLGPTNQGAFDLEAFDSGNGPEVYLATGNQVLRFTGVPPTQFASIAILSGTGSPTVRALCTFDDGNGMQLYAAGRFNTIGGVPAANIARWNGQAWSAVGLGIGPASTSTLIEVLRVIDDGSGPKLYAGGAFASAGGTSVSNLAAFDGQTWSNVGGGVAGTGARVCSVAGFDDGRGDGVAIYAGGSFATAGGVPARNLARFDGASWTGIHADGAIPTVLALEPVDLPTTSGRALVVGGDFDSIAGVPAQRIGILEACDEIGDTYCLGDGSSAACPCGNASATIERAGCVNSAGTGAALRASGSASTTNDSLVLDVSGMTFGPHFPTFFQGTSAASTPFGDGILCTSGSLLRIAILVAIGGSISIGQGTAHGVPVTTSGLIPPAGGTRYYQVIYRDAVPGYCTSATFDMSNGVKLVWRP